MNAIESPFVPGQRVWTIFTDAVSEQVVKEVSDSGEYVRLKGRGAPWLKNKEVFASKRNACLSLAAKFRERAELLLRHAGNLEEVSDR